jgi:hypothetical protein
LYIFNQPGGPNTCGANSMFKVRIIDPNTFSPTDVNSCGPYTVTEPEFGDYYSQPGGAGTIINPGTVINSTQTIYLYFETTVEPFCVIDTDIIVNIVPSMEVGQRDDVFECSSYTFLH